MYSFGQKPLGQGCLARLGLITPSGKHRSRRDILDSGKVPATCDFVSVNVNDRSRADRVQRARTHLWSGCWRRQPWARFDAGGMSHSWRWKTCDGVSVGEGIEGGRWANVPCDSALAGLFIAGGSGCWHSGLIFPLPSWESDECEVENSVDEELVMIAAVFEEDYILLYILASCP